MNMIAVKPGVLICIVSESTFETGGLRAIVHGFLAPDE